MTQFKPTINYRPLSYLNNFRLHDTIYTDEEETVKVYKAMKRLNPLSNKATPVIVKIIDLTNEEQDYIDRLFIYYIVLQDAKHDHLITVKESFFIKRSNKIECWIVMDECDYGTLYNYIEKVEQDDFQIKKRLISDIASGLIYIYYRGLHHGYLCPKNLLIQKDFASVYARLRINNYGLLDKIPIDETEMNNGL